jgi:hypothetical protein
MVKKHVALQIDTSFLHSRRVRLAPTLSAGEHVAHQRRNVNYVVS